MERFELFLHSHLKIKHSEGPLQLKFDKLVGLFGNLRLTQTCLSNPRGEILLSWDLSLHFHFGLHVDVVNLELLDETEEFCGECLTIDLVLRNGFRFYRVFDETGNEDLLLNRQ